ncbi:MAG: YkvA family protein [Lentisphaeria bacterium]
MSNSIPLLRLEPEQIPWANGVTSFHDPKFYLAFILYLAAFSSFAADPFFQQQGVFVYQQGVITLFLAFILAAAFNWELYLFGKPSGANLILQFLLILPLALFLARILSSASPLPEPVGFVAEFLSKIKNSLKTNASSLLPPWLLDLFVNWKISLLTVLFLFVLSLKHLHLKLAGILILLAIPLFTTLTLKPELPFLIGALLLLIGSSLQFCRYDKILYYENVIKAVTAPGEIDATLLQVLLLAMKKLFQRGEKLSEFHLLQIIKDAYGSQHPFSDEEFKLMAAEISKKMVYTYDLVHIQGTSAGFYMLPNPALFYYDNLLGGIAVFPRLVLSLAVAVIWVLLPIDLIPDAIPFFGTLDDIGVVAFASLILKNSLEQK